MNTIVNGWGYRLYNISEGQYTLLLHVYYFNHFYLLLKKCSETEANFRSYIVINNNK